jgi:hypothetical protein
LSLLLGRSITISIRQRRSILLLIIPLALSAFTHLWNPIGFPSLHADEGTYIHRAMQIFEGEGPLPQGAPFYDHPYFGQIFLASVLALIGYPDSLNPSDDGNVHSIEMLYLVPRVLMGLLAVVDTFLIYKIAERRYNRKVALIASILFAVMPMTWLLRRIMLDNILLPFLLTSVLLAMHTKKPEFKSSRINKNIPIILLSGIFLGLAIFTKIPAFTMIPLVGFIIYSNNKNDYNSIFKSLGLWFIPVILIPLIWPAAALSVGQFDNWEGAILRQTQREGTTLADSINTFFEVDPILLLIGIAGIIFAAVKKDFFLLLWTVPYLIFLQLIGFSSVVHLASLLPPFCVAAARMIVDLSDNISNSKKKLQQILPFAIISGIGIIGLVSITLLIITNPNSNYFNVYAFIVQHLPDDRDIDNSNEDQVTIIGRYWAKSYSWIPQYVFHKNIELVRDSSKNIILDPSLYSNKTSLPKDEKIILIVDRGMKHNILSGDMASEDHQYERIRQIYYSTNRVATFEDDRTSYDRNKYPYISMKLNRGIGNIEIRANYS